MSSGSPPIRVGCSGWHYKGWRGPVYPPELPTDRWLEAYAERFNTVELNNSFYRLPEAAQFLQWRSRVPDGFVFAVKASRYLTHRLRLLRPDEPIERLLGRAAHLGPTLGPLLYQLPPRWIPDQERLRTFLKALPAVVESSGAPRALTHVVEFRDPGSYTLGLLRLFEQHQVAMCVHDMEGHESPRIATGPAVYLRLHGYGRRYGGSYPDDVLDEWAAWLEASRAGRPAYVYFNNDIDGHAVANARTLRRLLRL